MENKVSDVRLEELSYWDESSNELDALMANLAAELLELRKSNAREVEQFSDGYKAAKDGLSENDEPTGYEINEDQWRVGYAWGMYDKFRADAKDSQEWNTDVIMPLYDQLTAAGYTGTLSEMVGQACALKEQVKELSNSRFVLIQGLVDIRRHYENKDGQPINDLWTWNSADHTLKMSLAEPLPVPPEGGAK
jgi:hypothetical protein